MASAQVGGAPTSAQVWDVRWIVDSSGPFAEGPSATAVGLTLVARVGIRPNTGVIFPTANFGVSRIGGAGSPSSGFHVTFSDALSAGLGLSQGTLQQGATAQGPFAEAPRNDADGNVPATGQPLAGAFFPFREAFSTGGLPNPGSNADAFNGTLDNPATGTPSFSNLTVDRARGWNTVTTPLGVATLDAAGNITGGDYAAIYRLIYIPREDTTPQGIRNITMTTSGASARYIFNVSGDFATGSGNFNIPTFTTTFQVPGPGAAALMGLAGLAAMRRRRA
jgi:uncharacterized protein (TIGR03382 family)